MYSWFNAMVGGWCIWAHSSPPSALRLQTVDLRLSCREHNILIITTTSPSQLPADNTIYTAVQRRVEAEHQSFELIPLILSAQLMDMVQLSTARSFNIFWGFPIIQGGEEKYGAMCRHGMQRSGIASMSAESVLWAAWDCCLLHQLHTC